MARINWSEPQQRSVESGVSKAVLYVYDAKTQGYNDGVSWNGITAVSEQQTGGEHNALYAGNKTYATVYSKEDYGINIEAYTYPDEFEVCDGIITDESGAKIGHQTRSRFGFCYRTEVGDGVTQLRGYKIHVVYGCQASPTEVSRKSIGESPEGIAFGWDCTTIPQELEGHSPSSMITLDSRVLHKVAMQDVENILYGTDTTPPTLPTMQTLMNVITEVTKEYVDKGDERTLEEANKHTQEIVDYLESKVAYKGIVTLDEEAQTNVNFNKDEIVQDGLVYAQPKHNNLITYTMDVNVGSQFIVEGHYDETERATPVTKILECINIGGNKVGFDSSGFPFGGFHGTPYMAFALPSRISGWYKIIITVISEKEIEIIFKRPGTQSGRNVILNQIITGSQVVKLFGISDTTYVVKNMYQTDLIYNRQLTPQELQHNFQVLNNTPSVSTIQTTDSKGNKQVLDIGAKSRHVVMDAGFNAEEAYTGVLKGFAETFTSTNGEITVPNAITPGKVISASMEGQTVKNYCVSINQTELSSAIRVKPVNLTNGKTYRLLADIEFETKYDQPFLVGRFYEGSILRQTISDMVIPKQKRDTYITDFTLDHSIVDMSKVDIEVWGRSNGKIKIHSYTIVDTPTELTKSVPFGLSSSTSTINANGQDYTIYEPTIQGLTKIVDANGNECAPGTTGARLVSLEPSVEGLPKLGKCDYVDRHSLIANIGAVERTYIGEENWKLWTTNGNYIGFTLDVNDISVSPQGVSPFGEWIVNRSVAPDSESVGGHAVSKLIRISLLISKLSTPDVEGFKQWLKTNPVTVRYQLATPQQIQLTPKQLKAYDKHMKVIELAKVGDSVDKLELKEDGSFQLTTNTEPVNTTLKFSPYMSIDNAKRYRTYLARVGGNYHKSNSYGIICSHRNNTTIFKMRDEGAVGICNYTDGNISYNNVYVAATWDEAGILETDDDNTMAKKVQNWYTRTGVVTKVPAITSTTTIPASLCPTIPLTQTTSTIKAGGNVSVSKLDVTAPVNPIKAIQQELAEMKRILASPSNQHILMNSLEDEYKLNQQREKELLS